MSTRRRQRSAPLDEASFGFTESELLVATCFGILCLSVLAVLGVFVFTLADANQAATTTTAITTTTFSTTATPAPTEPPRLNTCAGFRNLDPSTQREVQACGNTVPGICSSQQQQVCDLIIAITPDGGDVFAVGSETETVLRTCSDATCTTASASACACLIGVRACGREVLDATEKPLIFGFLCREARQCARFTDLALGDQPEEQPCALGTETVGACADAGTCTYSVAPAGEFGDGAVQVELRQCFADECLANDQAPCSCRDSVCTRSVGGQLFTMACD